MKPRFMFITGAVLMMVVLVLAACGGTPSSSTGASNSNQVHVTLSDFKVQSSQTTFVAGRTYHFVVTNTGHTNHEFMAMQPMSGMNTNMQQMDSMALYRINANELPAGAAKSFTYTFPASAVQKPLEFACHLPGHYEAGMHLSITINS